MATIIEDYYAILVLSVLTLFALGDIIIGSYHRGKRRKDDLAQEAVGFIQLYTLVQPAVVALALLLMGVIFPNAQNEFLGTTLWVALPFYLLVDDCSQYWYH